MNIEKVIEEIRTYIQEIVHLRELAPRNQEYELWRHKVRAFIQAVFGKDSEEYRHFPTQGMAMMYTYAFGGSLEQDYQQGLTSCETALKQIIVRHETLKKLGLPGATKAAALQLPKAFIAHGGTSKALDKLKDFLRALGVEPLVVEEQAIEGREKEQNIEKYFEEADCEIVLATYGEIVDEKTGTRHPRLNVIDELARGRKRFPNKVILLLEKDVELHTNVSGIVHERFTKDNMTDAFIRIATELKAFGILQAIKPKRA